MLVVSALLLRISNVLERIDASATAHGHGSVSFKLVRDENGVKIVRTLPEFPVSLL